MNLNPKKNMAHNSEDIQNTEIRALWWKQPYASAMLNGKRFETRTWDTKYRGLVLICSTKKPYIPNQLWDIAGAQDLALMDAIMNCHTKDLNGFALAIGVLIDSRPMRPEDEAQAFVKYNPDLFIHEYSDVRPILPFELKGKQGWMKVSDDVKSQITFRKKFILKSLDDMGDYMEAHSFFSGHTIKKIVDIKLAYSEDDTENLRPVPVAEVMDGETKKYFLVWDNLNGYSTYFDDASEGLQHCLNLAYKELYVDTI